MYEAGLFFPRSFFCFVSFVVVENELSLVPFFVSCCFFAPRCDVNGPLYPQDARRLFAHFLLVLLG